MKLAEKIAFITGGGGGLGLVFAKALLSEGAKLMITDIDEILLEKAVKELKDFAGRFSTAVLDVTSSAQVNEVIKKTYEQYGRLDILVNVAGGSLSTPKNLDEITEEYWNKVLDVNLKGTFFCCQAAVKYMAKHNYGKIINVSSIGGRTASIVTGVPYAAAKGGVISLTRRLALEVGRYGINVNAIAPGTILSGERMIKLWNELSEQQKSDILLSIPLGRLSTADEQARVLVFLASDDSSYIHGAVIDVNGGRLMA